jgi:hypothetical protein
MVMADDRGSDLDVERAIWRECAGACDALAGAIRRAEEVMPGLPGPSRQLARDELTGLVRRTCLLLMTVGFPVNERNDP